MDPVHRNMYHGQNPASDFRGYYTDTLGTCGDLWIYLR